MEIRARAAVRVDAAPERAFAVLTDPARFHEWQAGMTPARTDPGPVGPGSRLHGHRRLAGMSVPFTTEVVSWEPPRHMAFRSVRTPLQVRGEYTVVPSGTGSRITVALGVHVPRWSPLRITARIGPAVTAQLQQDLAALGGLLDRPTEQAGR